MSASLIRNGIIIIINKRIVGRLRVKASMRAYFSLSLHKAMVLANKYMSNLQNVYFWSELTNKRIKIAF
jgi:hypothetical protein